MSKMYNLQLLFTATFIRAKIAAYAAQITKLYQGKSLVIIGVLRGGIYFTTTLTQFLHNKTDLQMDFINFQSYRGRKKALKPSLQDIKFRLNLKNKHLLILDDIFDSGLTLQTLDAFFQQHQPLSIRYAVLVMCSPQLKTNPFFSSRTIDHLILWQKPQPQSWLVGFGMELNEYGRHFHNIYMVVN